MCSHDSGDMHSFTRWKGFNHTRHGLHDCGIWVCISVSCVFTCVHLTWFIRCVDVWYAPRTPSFRSCCIPTCSLGNKSLSLADSKEKQNTENYPLPVRGDACEILRICCFCRNTLSSVQFIKHRNWRGNIDTSTQEYSADFETGENETQITHSKINFGWNGMRWKSNCMLLMIIITNI